MSSKHFLSLSPFFFSPLSPICCTSQLLVAFAHSYSMSAAPVNNCFFCYQSDKPLSRCARCRSAWYCSSDCQRNHRSDHRTLCKQQSNFMKSHAPEEMQSVEDFVIKTRSFLDKDVLDTLYGIPECVYQFRQYVLEMRFSVCRKKLLSIRFISKDDVNEATKHALNRHSGPPVAMIVYCLEPNKRCVSLGILLVSDRSDQSFRSLNVEHLL